MRLGVEAALVDGLLVRGDVELDDGRVVAIGLAAPRGRGIAVPGFVDLQVNGFGGVDFLDADADGYRRAGEALLETGVTAYLPTLITTPEQQLLAAMAEVPNGESRPRVLGMHLEGPFLSPNRLGTHESSARRDPVEHLLHGDRRIDHYAWLREKDNPEVIAHLSAENAYTDAVLARVTDDYEILVVNDASPDDQAQVLASRPSP